MKPTNPVAVAEAARARKNGHKPEREPIPLNPNGAVMSVINQVLQQDAIKIALGSFLEGRDLPGQWALRITGAELVPAPVIRA
jgi:hypothetical protein